jgi:DNA-3-methyladenine glycosylase I
MTSLIIHPDGRARCPWPGTDPLYVAYHDTDWGVPERDDRALFEKLLLDGFQAGLSPGSRSCASARISAAAFDGFEPESASRAGGRERRSRR